MWNWYRSALFTVPLRYQGLINAIEEDWNCMIYLTGDIEE